MPRYLPVQLDAANPEIKRVYAEFEREVGSVPNFLKTLAHSGNFLDGVAQLYRTMLGETALSEKIRTLVILQTCRLNKCKSMVEQFREKARKAGWSQEQLEAIGEYASSEVFTYYEKEALRLAEMVTLEPDGIQDDFWTQLDNHFTSDQVVEMVALIGFFNMVNRFILALGVDPDPVPAPTADSA